MIFTFLPAVSRTIFSSWVCVPYENYEAGVAPEGEPGVISFLWSDPRVVCGSDAHTELKGVALLFVMLWPVGMLSLFVFVLVYNRRELSKGQYISGFAKAVRCLTGGYKDKYYYWEIIEVTRRLAVCGWVVLIPVSQVFYRLIFSLGVSVLCLVATAVALPCRRPEDNFLSIFAQTTLLFSFGACTLIKILTADSVTDEQLDSVIGFHSAQGPFFVLCFFSLAFCFVLLVIYIKTFFAEFAEVVKKASSQPMLAFAVAPVCAVVYAQSTSLLHIEGCLYPHADGISRLTQARATSMTAQALTSNSASTGLAVGAVVTGLLAGALGGFFFGITGGIMGGLIFGLLGGIAGMSMASFCSCCAEKKRLKRLSATVRVLCRSQHARERSHVAQYRTVNMHYTPTHATMQALNDDSSWTASSGDLKKPELEIKVTEEIQREEHV